MYSVSEAFFYVDLKRILDKFINCNMLERVDYTLIEILVAAEDRRFFKHPGFDIFAILRATFFYIFQKKRSGASTVEQQLVRTITQDREYSLKRKMKEVILASALGYRFSKNKIAECYLLSAYYGHNIKGLSGAIKKYIH